MSLGADVAVSGGRAPYRGRSPLSESALEDQLQSARPVARLVTFSALALYGVLRWMTLLNPIPGWRMLGLLALAIAVAAGVPALDTRRRELAVIAGVCAVIAMLTISGIPLGWLLRLRITVISQGIGQGLQALPGVLVPYEGFNEWVRIVIVLGAGVLLLDAALLIAFAPQTLGDLRRIGAALPLTALAVVPSTLARPQFPYLQGLVLFGLVAAFIWSERTVRHHAAGAIAVAAIAGIGAVVLAPGLDQHHPWINYEAIANKLTNENVDSFDWAQTYGPLDWPQKGRTVLQIKARHPDYWKTENLDVFNGTAWTQGSAPTGSQLPSPAEAAIKRYSQTIEVTISGMSTSQVVSAGSAFNPPTHIDDGVAPGVSPGTWIADVPLTTGDTYKVDTYSPQPTPAQLQVFGGDYLDSYAADQLAAGLTVELPTNGLTVGAQPEVAFAPFHSGTAPENVIGPYQVDGRQLIEGSPYARMYSLATQLADQAATPYAFVESVERYLSTANGFSYDQNPAPAQFPLETFLFGTHKGYCQQFAGAMALLLRMGGVPARVATGFATGSYDSASKQYVVSDLDAHAWVEVWFPYYGWVKFDPTPPTPRSLAGGSIPAASVGSNTGSLSNRQPRGAATSSAGRAGATSHGGGGGSPLLLVLALVAILIAALAAVIRGLRRRPPPTGDQLVAELERAMRRSGRPLEAGVTLASLEHRFGEAPAAEGYVRVLRLARFAGTAELPNRAQRRALRGQLAAGRGVAARVRRWWALPPRLGVRRGS